jgi:hypothetical protein
VSLALDGTTPRSRQTDPVTSVDAGRGADLNESQNAVVSLFQAAAGGMADHELVALAEWAGVKYTPQRIRSARSELTEKGLVEITPGKFRPTKSGRRARVFELKAAA